MTWADHGDQKGFHVFDTETRELEFIPNPFTMFHKIHYNDRDKSMEQVTNIEFEKYNKCFVKIIVSEKNNPFWFDMFVDKLEKAGPIHVQVVEDHLHLDMESDDDIVSEAEDTMTILHNYIEALDINVDKNKLEYTIKNLYSDALSIS